MSGRCDDCGHVGDVFCEDCGGAWPAELQKARREALEEAAKFVLTQDLQDRNAEGLAEDIRALAKEPKP